MFGVGLGGDQSPPKCGSEVPRTFGEASHPISKGEGGLSAGERVEEEGIGGEGGTHGASRRRGLPCSAYPWGGRGRGRSRRTPPWSPPRLNFGTWGRNRVARKRKVLGAPLRSQSWRSGAGHGGGPDGAIGGSVWLSLLLRGSCQVGCQSAAFCCSGLQRRRGRKEARLLLAAPCPDFGLPQPQPPSLAQPSPAQPNPVTLLFLLLYGGRSIFLIFFFAPGRDAPSRRDAG